MQQKKYRQRNRAFLVEGAKSVAELLQSDLKVQLLLATPAFLEEFAAFIPADCPVETVTEEQLSRVGSFESNNAALAVAAMREDQTPELRPADFALALDEVRDPGNLGTILRIADWYGLRHIFCSAGCADFYNPKVISSSMGSFCRVQAHYVELPELFAAQPALPVYGAVLNGQNVHRLALQPQGFLVMGNEAHGLSDEVAAKITNPVTIPRFGQAESLNVAIATAILCDHFFHLPGAAQG